MKSHNIKAYDLCKFRSSLFFGSSQCHDSNIWQITDHCVKLCIRIQILFLSVVFVKERATYSITHFHSLTHTTHTHTSNIAQLVINIPYCTFSTSSCLREFSSVIAVGTKLFFSLQGKGLNKALTPVHFTEQPGAGRCLLHIPKAPVTGYITGHNHKPFSEPQSLCALVGQIPMSPLAVFCGCIGGPVFHDKDKSCICSS